jgi:hypothetical protein
LPLAQSSLPTKGKKKPDPYEALAPPQTKFRNPDHIPTALSSGRTFVVARREHLCNYTLAPSSAGPPRGSTMDQLLVVTPATRSPEPPSGFDYNLFRRIDLGDLYCAVPEYRAVPRFIGGGWEFVGRVSEGTTATGFRDAWVREGVALNGYYVFFSPPTGSGRVHPLKAAIHREIENSASATASEKHEVIVIRSEPRVRVAERGG